MFQVLRWWLVVLLYVLFALCQRVNQVVFNNDLFFCAMVALIGVGTTWLVQVVNPFSPDCMWHALNWFNVVLVKKMVMYCKDLMLMLHKPEQLLAKSVVILFVNRFQRNSLYGESHLNLRFVAQYGECTCICPHLAKRMTWNMYLPIPTIIISLIFFNVQDQWHITYSKKHPTFLFYFVIFSTHCFVWRYSCLW